MNVGQGVVERIEGVGGKFVVNGERIRVRLPQDAIYLIEELRAHRSEVLCILKGRKVTPPMPDGVCLISWQLKEAPVMIETCAVVTDPDRFARSTLMQLATALSHLKRWVGWTHAQLVDRLAQIGVLVSLTSEAKERHG